MGAALALITVALVGLSLHNVGVEQRRMRLFTHGEVAVGRVTGVASDLGHTLYYEFETPDSRQQGSVDMGEREVTEGEAVMVFYERGAPDFHRAMPHFVTDKRLMP